MTAYLARSTTICPTESRRGTNGSVNAKEDFYISHKYFHYKIPLNAPMRQKMKETIYILSMFTTPNVLDIQTRIHLQVQFIYTNTYREEPSVPLLTAINCSLSVIKTCC